MTKWQSECKLEAKKLYEWMFTCEYLPSENIKKIFRRQI